MLYPKLGCSNCKGRAHADQRIRFCRVQVSNGLWEYHIRLIQIQQDKCILSWKSRRF